jgi:hypothetical protein
LIQNGYCYKKISNKWSGGRWSISGGPSLEQDLVFEENFDSTTDDADGVVEGCSCLVKSDKAVVLNPGHSLIIEIMLP